MPQKPPSAPLSFFLFFAGMLLVYWVLRTHGLQPGVPVMRSFRSTEPISTHTNAGA